MSAVLKIYGDIGESSGMDELIGYETVSAKQVSEFLDQHKSERKIVVRINSRGGDVQEGWAIYDLLVNSGKNIKTIGEGKIYSIATIIFLAGEEREIYSNADGLIHNPFIPPYTLADQYEADDLEKIAESLRQEESKILQFYAQKTGAEESRLAELMKEDTKLSAQDMVDLGFATKIIEPVMAFAYLKPNKFIMDEKAFFEKLGSTLDNALARMKNFSRLETVDQTLKDKDGKEFKLEKETGAPAVGDKASPDGTYVMSDGKTIVVAEGAITEIREKTEDKSELELANEKIAQLEAANQQLTERVTAMEAEKPDLVAAQASAKKAETDAKTLYDELSKIKNEWKPDGRTKFSTADKVGSIDLARVRELNEKLKSKSE